MKLTNKIRQEIVDKVISDKFDKSIGKIETEMNKLSLQIYNDNISKKYRDLMEKLPSNYFQNSSSICVKGKINIAELLFGRRSSFGALQLKLPKSKPLPEYLQYSDFTLSPKIEQKLNRLDFEAKNILSKKKSIEQELTIILHSCTTINQLLGIWPEGEKYIEVKTKNLPSVTSHKLNNLLGLN